MVSKELVDRVLVVLTIAPDLFQIQFVLEEFVPRILLDNADPVAPEDDLEAIGAEADRRRQVMDIAVDEADQIDQRAAGDVFDPGGDPMTVKFELDFRVNL
jgi:hypothetical protein